MKKDSVTIPGIRDRFFKMVHDSGFRAFDFSSECGLPIYYANNFSGKNINMERLAKVFERFPQYSISWLLLGDGPMLVGSPAQESSSDDRVSELLAIISRQSKVIESQQEIISQYSEKQK